MKEKHAEKWPIRILTVMRAENYRPMKQHEFAKMLNVSSAQKNKLRSTLRSLVEQGTISKSAQNRYSLKTGEKVFEGTISLHAKGFGFVAIDNEDMDDVFIPPTKTGHARSRDRVRIEVRASRSFRRKQREPSGDERMEGKVVEILERGFTEVAGVLKKKRNNWYLFPNDPRFPASIHVDDFKEGVLPKAGHLALVELLEGEPSEYEEDIKGRLLELGDRAGSPGADMWVLIRNFDLPLSFPPEVEREANALPSTFTKEQKENRTDCRKIFTLTIDPVTARDFDDALSLEVHKGGALTLYIHIADVAAFVTQDSAIEAEAVKRAFSVYLPDRVIPMLPERLTTDLCSLVPGKDRLAHTVEIDMGASGAIKGHRSYRSIIHSDVRLTYEQAQEVIDGPPPQKGDKPEVALVHKLYNLSQKIRKRRMKAGALDINSSERKCLYDQDGRITGIEIRRPLPAYQLVEECMLLANKAVAVDLYRTYEDAMYRLHEPPNESQWEKMAQDLSNIGVDVAPQSREDISRLLATIQPESLRSVALITVLKNIKRAEYSPEIGEHFGLAFTHYAHFTSPIRRYPDLVIHRLLNHLEAGKKRPFDKKTLSAWAQSSSVRERAAEEAERAATHLKCLQFFEQEMKKGNIGPHKAIITGLNASGVTLELSDFLQRAFASFAQPQQDEIYQFKSRNGYAETSNKKKRLRIGDEVRVEVVLVNIAERRMEVQLCKGTKPKKTPRRSLQQNQKKRIQQNENPKSVNEYGK